MMAVYLASTIVLHRSEDVQKVDCDMASAHGLLSRIPIEAPPFELLLEKAAALYQEHPPEKIEEAVKVRMKRSEPRIVPAPPVIPTASSRSQMFLKSVVFVAAPVIVGVFILRYVQNQYTV